MSDERKYTTFTRSMLSFEDMGRAKKRKVSDSLTLDEARAQCAEYNDNRTSAQKRKGTKMEFTSAW